MPEDQPQTPSPEQPSQTQTNAAAVATETQPPVRASFGAQLLLGAFAFLLLLVGIGSFVLIAASHPHGSGPMLAISLIPTGMGVLVLVRRAKRGPGLWVGFLISLGFVALAGGICASILA